MSARRPSPVRTCVGCRERAPKAELLRVVVVEGALVPDEHARLPGRGASLHPDPSCIDLAERRRAFERALRLPGPLDTTAVRRAVEDRAARRATEPPLHDPVGAGTSTESDGRSMSTRR